MSNSIYPILAANSSWFVPNNSSITRSSIVEIEIVDNYITTGSEIASWDASSDKDGSVMVHVVGTKLYISGNGSGKIALNADSSSAFANFTSLTTFIGGSLLYTSNATTFAKMFQMCSALLTVDVSNWDTSNVKSINAMFQGAASLTTLDVSRWQTSSVTDMSAFVNMSASAPNTTLITLDVSGWQTGNVTTMKQMFYNCDGLTYLNVTNWDVGKVTNMANLFGSNATGNLANLDVSNWNVQAVKDMQKMFRNQPRITSLNLENWNTKSVTNMSYMFMGDTALTTIGNVSGWNTSACTTMLCMFYQCISLEYLNVSNWDVSKVTSFSNMFACGSTKDYPMTIQNLDVSKWNTSSATDMSFMFYGCRGPEHVDVSNWKVSKVKNFDHMFAHSYLTVGDVSKWDMSSATNINALFHTVQHEIVDVTGWDVSNVQVFSQLFDANFKLKEIIGLETWNTSSGLGFNEMFINCNSLKKLNLSSFDTRKARDGFQASANGSFTNALKDMFKGMYRLEEITIGANFSFNGDGTATDCVAVLPTPLSNYIDAADGKWHTSNKVSYSPEQIPNLTAMTYYASPYLAFDGGYNTYISKGGLLYFWQKILDKLPTKIGDIASNAGFATEDYVDNATTTLKNELLNGAGAAYDTLKELGDLIDENTDALDALETVASGKQNKITGTAGQFVVIGDDGNVTTKDIPYAENGSFGVNLITFTIYGTEYHADEGMTWKEWVDSEYNTVGIFIDEDGIRYPTSGIPCYIYTTNYDNVLQTDIINESETYIWE